MSGVTAEIHIVLAGALVAGWRLMHRIAITASRLAMRRRLRLNSPHMTAPASRSNDPLHGITLETIVTRLVERLGWEELGRIVPVRCFLFDPSVSSSLKFLRKTPWARKKVEDLYVAVQAEDDSR